jgi:hypothetical protein
MPNRGRLFFVFVMMAFTAPLFGQQDGIEVHGVTAKPASAGVTRLTWNAESPDVCKSVTYSVYHDTNADFTPSAKNQIASRIKETHFDAPESPESKSSFYRVKVVQEPVKAPAGVIFGVRPTSQPGSVRGRVFAITKGGDLKPARLATVRLLLQARSVGHKVDKKYECEETAELVFLTKQVELKERESDASCKRELILDMDATIAAEEWSQVKPRQWQFLETDADEEGNFVFPKVPSGKYNVIVQAQAGINDAFWNQEVWVRPGESVNVKVSEIETTCSNLE